MYGSPGVGKSRVAERAFPKDDDRYAWVDASMLRDLPELVSATGRALELELQSDESVDAGAARIGSALAASDHLNALVFDDFDPLVETAAGLIRDWSNQSKPNLVVTSRQRLGFPSTRPVEIDPLDRAEAVELFAAHARQVRPEFHLERHRDAVEQLVEGLDRLPYAVELAARRAHVLSPEQMLERLDERFALLRDRSADRVEGIEVALEWTWQWLSDAERQFLKQCCAFAAPFGSEALEEVIHLDDDVAWLDILDALVSKSWLKREPVEELEGALRFRLLNTVQAFVERREVEGSPETKIGAAERRTAEHYARVAAERGPEVTGPEGKRALDRLEVGRPHFLAAARFWLEEGDRRAFEVVEGLRWMALLRGPLSPYASFVEEAAQLAERLDEVTSETRLRTTLAQVYSMRGSRDRAVEAVERARQLAADQPAGLRALVARTHGSIESAADARSAREILEPALDWAEEADDAFLEARIYEQLGYVDIRLFQLNEAEREFRRARELFGEGRSPLFEADSLAGIAYIEQRQNRLDDAIETFQRVAELHRNNSARTSHAEAMFNLGVCQHIVGSLSHAETCIEKALEDWRQLGLTYYLPAGRFRLGAIALERAEHGTCTELLERAAETADRAGDLQTLAKARGFRALYDWMIDERPDPEVIAQARAQIDAGADPDVAAAFSVALVATTGEDGEEHVAELSRIEELLALLAPGDHYYREVLERLLAIARGFDHCRSARAAVDGSHRRDFASEVVSELASVFEFESRTELAAEIGGRPNPFVRLLGGQLVAELKALGVAVDRARPEADYVLEVHSNCHWYCVDEGESVDLSNRKSTRLILKSILQTHLDDPEAALDVEALIEAGWPDEYMTFDSGRSRVYAAIKFLRDNGLSEIIETTDDGYRIAPNVDVQIAPTTGLQMRR